MKNLKKIAAALALVALVAVVAYPQGAGTLRERYVSGVYQLVNAAGGVVWSINPTTKAVTIPSGSSLTIAGTLVTTGEVTYDSEAIDDDSIVDADINSAAAIAYSKLDLAGAIVNADIATAAAIARSKLAEDALQPYGVSIFDLRHTTGVPLVATETAGGFNVSVSSEVILAQAEITDNETETSVVYFQFVLPPEYVAAGDVTVRLPCALIATDTPTDNGSTIDVAVYEQTNGAVGSDLSTTTSAATFAALDTYYNKDFVITAAGLVAGDVLVVKITASVIDSEAGGGTIILNLAAPKVLLDIKG